MTEWDKPKGTLIGMIDFISMIFYRATVVWASKSSLFRSDGAVMFCSPTQALGGLSSSINTARASLNWSRFREVSARRNRH